MSPNQAPPPAQLFQLLMGKFISKSISVAADFGFADVLATGDKSAEEIASAASTSADATFRVLRALSAVGVFTQTGPRSFANTPVSECLRSDVVGSQRAMAQWINCETGWDSWGELGHSVKTGRAASMKLFGDDIFRHLNDHAVDGKYFNDAMTSFSSMTAMAVAAGYDFGNAKCVVDVGGGHGLLLASILQKHPNVTGKLFDLPAVVQHAGARFEGLAHRVEKIGGSFLESVPAGGDVYIMKHIIHDWDDERSVKILAHCKQAMAKGGRVLVVEGVVSDRPEATGTKLLDLEMLVMTPGGRERTADEYAALFAQAGLQLSRVVPTQSPVQVIEAVGA